MELKLSTVQKALVRLASHYPDSGHTVAMLQDVAEDWAEDLRPVMGDQTFLQCVKLARQRCQFFPKLSDLFKMLDAVNREPQEPSDCLTLPEGPTFKSPEEIRRNKERAKILSRLAAGEFGVNEAFKKMREVA